MSCYPHPYPTPDKDPRHSGKIPLPVHFGTYVVLHPTPTPRFPIDFIFLNPKKFWDFFRFWLSTVFDNIKKYIQVYNGSNGKICRKKKFGFY